MPSYSKYSRSRAKDTGWSGTPVGGKKDYWTANPVQAGPPAAPLSPMAPKPFAAQPAPAANPWDPTYAKNLSNLFRSDQQATANTNYDETMWKKSFGFDDMSDPYSKARMLERSYQQSLAGTRNSMAARGQLYSGANQQAQDQDLFSYDRSRDATRKEYDAGLEGFRRQRQAQAGALEQGKTDALEALYYRQMAEREDPGPAPAPPPAPKVLAAAPKKSKPKKKKKKSGWTAHY